MNTSNHTHSLTHAQMQLIQCCDDLMRAIGHGRDLNPPIGNAVATVLLDRILDIRNIVKNPHPQQQPQPKAK
jgi:hypothetical protein